jgi:hypothetical protein
MTCHAATQHLKTKKHSWAVPCAKPKTEGNKKQADTAAQQTKL